MVEALEEEVVEDLDEEVDVVEDLDEEVDVVEA